MDESLSKGSYHSYEVYEEECVETLSDDDNQHSFELKQSRHQDDNDDDNNNYYHAQYIEEEVVVGDDDDDDDVDEVEYVEEEVLESAYHAVASLPGISEGDDENDDHDDAVEEEEEEVVLTDNENDDDDYDEVEVHMNGSQSIYSESEVEIVDDDDDDDDEDYRGDAITFVEEVLVEEYYDDDDEHDVGLEVIHNCNDSNDNNDRYGHKTVSIRRVSDESLTEEQRRDRSFRKLRSSSSRSNQQASKSTFQIRHLEENRKHQQHDDYDDDDEEEVEEDETREEEEEVVGVDENDGASAEELTEAIEYVLRQERAVSKFILTEEQATTMAHLPTPVMKIIVDHLEACDMEAQPIDWDFLLKIVCPYCDEWTV